MGASQSGEATLPSVEPWAPLRPGGFMPAGAKERVLALTQSANAFLVPVSPLPVIMAHFSLERHMHRMQGALDSDPRLRQWLPKLVPRRVSEEAFWHNYFSHIAAIALEPAAPPSAAASSGGAEVGDAEDADNTAGLSEADLIASQQRRLQRVMETHSLREEEARRREGHREEEAERQGPRPPPKQHAPGTFAGTPVIMAEDDEEFCPRPAAHTHLPDSLPPVRWGIIGCGNVCEVKSGPAFQKARGSRLVAVMRRTAHLAQDFAMRHNVPKCYTDAHLLIADPEVDAVYVATPPGSHLQYALECAAAGKACYVEKPMARSAEECEKMVQRFRARQVPLFVGYYRRGLEKFQVARELVSRLGVVTSVQLRLHRDTHVQQGVDFGWRVQAEHSGGGLFMDLGSHALDALDFLLGPLSHVTGDAVSLCPGQPVDVETVVNMGFRLRNGALGTGEWNFASSQREDMLTITGSNGQLTMSIFGKDGPLLHLRDGRRVQYTCDTPAHVHLPLVQRIVDQLRAKRLPPQEEDDEEDGASKVSEVPSTGDTALRTSQVMDSVLRKFYRSRKDHFWKRPATWQSAADPVRPDAALQE